MHFRVMYSRSLTLEQILSLDPYCTGRKKALIKKPDTDVRYQEQDAMIEYFYEIIVRNRHKYLTFFYKSYFEFKDPRDLKWKGTNLLSQNEALEFPSISLQKNDASRRIVRNLFYIELLDQTKVTNTVKSKVSFWTSLVNMYNKLELEDRFFAPSSIALFLRKKKGNFDRWLCIVKYYSNIIRCVDIKSLLTETKEELICNTINLEVKDIEQHNKYCCNDYEQNKQYQQIMKIVNDNLNNFPDKIKKYDIPTEVYGYPLKCVKCEKPTINVGFSFGCYFCNLGSGVCMDCKIRYSLTSKKWVCCKVSVSPHQGDCNAKLDTIDGIEYCCPHESEHSDKNVKYDLQIRDKTDIRDVQIHAIVHASIIV